MKASILAIGTELTTGQIINKNAASISEKLKACGIETLIHLTVPDDKKLILESLHYIAPQSDLVFVTGGLGPTSDDFTRDVVAEWAKLELIFDEKSWQHINTRLQSRGFQVREMQRQQCFYPKGSKILENKEGTANAFQFEHDKQTVFVLPGPPREIESVWHDYIHSYLNEKTKTLNKRITKSWDTLGVGESDIAYLVEDVLKKFPKSKQLEVGYRVHLPYVEVKITLDENQMAVFHETLLQVDHALAHVTFSRDFSDVATKVFQLIAEQDFTFYDFISNGYLHARLSPFLKNQKQWSFKQARTTDITIDFFEHEDDFLALLPFEDDQKCLLVYSLNEERGQKTIEAPMKSTLMSERRKQYFSEMALVEFIKGL